MSICKAQKGSKQAVKASSFGPVGGQRCGMMDLLLTSKALWYLEVSGMSAVDPVSGGGRVGGEPAASPVY